ncbi:Cysteine-rich receptor-like protein kinase 10 [Hordeum vulgare]|nr:Cysteine-rich receptor-like protein kinase 10 [Hordeum vulgare]
MEPGASSSHLMRPKTETGLLPVKREHLTMAADDDEAALKWARDDYFWGEMERQRRALEEISARRRSREEGGVFIIDESDEEASASVRLGDLGQGSSKDNSPAGDDGVDDYTAFYKLLGM